MLKSLSTVWPYLGRYRKGLSLGIGALMMKALLASALPLVTRQGVDAMTGGFQVSLVLRFAGLLIAVALLKGFFQYWMRVIIISISRDIEFDLRNDLFRHLVELSQDFYARFRTGDIMARSTNDLNAVRMMLGPGIMYWAETSLTFILSVAVMLHTNVRLTLMALLPAPFVSLAVIFFGRRIHKRFEHIQSMFSDISSRVQENLAGVRVVRAYAQEKAEVAQFEQLNLGYVGENVGLARLQGFFSALLQAFIGLTFVLVMWAGGQQVLAHHITIGSFAMFNMYMGMLIWPMIAFGWVVNLMQRGTASLNRINEILHQKPTIAKPQGAFDAAAERATDIRFENVTVDFEGRKALSALTLGIGSGETVAIVGQTWQRQNHAGEFDSEVV